MLAYPDEFILMFSDTYQMLFYLLAVYQATATNIKVNSPAVTNNSQ